MAARKGKLPAALARRVRRARAALRHLAEDLVQLARQGVQLRLRVTARPRPRPPAAPPRAPAPAGAGAGLGDDLVDRPELDG